MPSNTYRSCLNGILVQERDSETDNVKKLDFITTKKPNLQEIEDLIFASKFVNIPNRIQLFWQKMVNYWPQVQDKPQE